MERVRKATTVVHAVRPRRVCSGFCLRLNAWIPCLGQKDDEAHLIDTLSTSSSVQARSPCTVTAQVSTQPAATSNATNNNAVKVAASVPADSATHVEPVVASSSTSDATTRHLDSCASVADSAVHSTGDEYSTAVNELFVALSAQCEACDELVDKNAGVMHTDASSALRAAVCKARLLTGSKGKATKFKQLVQRHLTPQESDPQPVKMADLDGFWAALMVDMDDVRRAFVLARAYERNAWQPLSAEQLREADPTAARKDVSLTPGASRKPRAPQSTKRRPGASAVTRTPRAASRHDTSATPSAPGSVLGSRSLSLAEIKAARKREMKASSQATTSEQDVHIFVGKPGAVNA